MQGFVSAVTDIEPSDKILNNLKSLNNSTNKILFFFYIMFFYIKKLKVLFIFNYIFM